MSKIIKIIAIILLVVACASVFVFWPRDEVVIDNTKALYTAENLPVVDASLATQPLMSALVENFTAGAVKGENIEYTNTHPGYVRLINGEADILIVTQPSEEELALAKEKGVELEVIPVVKEGFVFYVNKDNPVNNLSSDEIQKIYAGQITNWKDVSGEDKEIRAFQRPVNSGSQTGMLALVMKDYELMEAPKENLVATMQEIVNMVSSYDNGLNSIGYSYYYYAKTMFQDINKQVADNIKFININGVEPTNENIQSGNYPYTTAYYIVINKAEPDGSPVREMVKHMLSERGQRVAEEIGYVPVN